MEKLTDLFDFQVRHIEDGVIEVLDVANYPQDDKNSFDFFKNLELLNINNGELIFPLHIKHWEVVITPDNDDTIKKYYKIDGIKTILDENKSKLINKTTFFKPEITFPPNSIYPNFILHFYQVDKEGGIYVIDDLDMFETCLIHYEDTKQFTEDRIETLNKLVNVAELQQFPFLPIELIRFTDDREIEEIEAHLLAKKGCK
ncbi:hypothetical protein GCM10011508_02920 [Flavobacterium lutivivi]|nr:hypothetical protein GCM10011508_02920 [Flavobacterium lutivivi]